MATGFGAVHKEDILDASLLLEKKKEYATVLAFDVGVTPESQELAKEIGVKIFDADNVDEFFDQVNSYIDNVKEKKDASEYTFIPCVHNIIPIYDSNEKDHSNLGMRILDATKELIIHGISSELQLFQNIFMV